MKKKKMFFITILLLSILCPLQVMADDNDIDFSCSKEALIGSNITCTVNLKTNQNIKGVEAHYESTDVLSYVSSKSSDSWSTIKNNSLGFIVIETDGVSKNSEVIKSKYVVSNKAEVSKTYAVKLSNITLSDGTNDIPIADKIANIKILSINNILENITVNSKPLEVTDGVTSYTVNVSNDTDKVELTANLKSDNYKFVDGYGSRVITDLKEGDNLVELKIANNEGELIAYTINISKSAKANIKENPNTGGYYILKVVIILLITGFATLGIYKYNKKGKKA